MQKLQFVDCNMKVPNISLLFYYNLKFSTATNLKKPNTLHQNLFQITQSIE